MSLKAWLAGLWAQRRVAQVARLQHNAVESRAQLLRQLVEQGRQTAFGRDHKLHQVHNAQDFAQAVPIRDYEGLRPWLDRTAAGEPDVTWPGRPQYLAKTSGTTSGAKYIPITRESLKGQVAGARDALLFYLNRTGNARFIGGKMLLLSGSPAMERNAAGLPVGRLSGIAHLAVPAYLRRNRLPSFAVNTIEDWDTKLERMVDEAIHADLRLISGIPPWMQMFLERAEAVTGKRPTDIWPNLQVFMQGGVDYAPYQAMFEAALGTRVDVVEVYPASEGFIAVQTDLDDHGLALMLDYGVVHEFVPLEDLHDPNCTPRRLGLHQVELGVHYAIVLTTNAGLWAYNLGDTVRFTSLDPPKLRVTGRVKQFLNAFGEHVIEEEANQALRAAAEGAGAVVAEATLAPLIQDDGQSRHEWFVEFVNPPQNPTRFAQLLDETLRQRNIYYQDLRANGMLLPPAVWQLQPGAARAYMSSIGKLGGQNKFPRLSNNRSVADGLQPHLANRLNPDA